MDNDMFSYVSNQFLKSDFYAPVTEIYLNSVNSIVAIRKQAIDFVCNDILVDINKASSQGSFYCVYNLNRSQLGDGAIVCIIKSLRDMGYLVNSFDSDYWVKIYIMWKHINHKDRKELLKND